MRRRYKNPPEENKLNSEKVRAGEDDLQAALDEVNTEGSKAAATGSINHLVRRYIGCYIR